MTLLTFRSREIAHEKNRKIWENRSQIIDDFIDHLNENPFNWTIKDESVLPHSRQDIITAMNMEIRSSQNILWIQTLASAMPWLSEYQAGVGTRPIKTSYSILSEIAKAGPEIDTEKSTKMIFDVTSKSRNQKFEPMFKSDMDKLTEIAKNSLDSNRVTWSRIKKIKNKVRRFFYTSWSERYGS